MPEPVSYDGKRLDLSSRIVASTTVAASPAAAAETIIAAVRVPGDIGIISGVHVVGWAAYTVGASGTAVQFRVRTVDVSGTVKAASGALTVTAANLRQDSIVAFDASGAANTLYNLTMIVTAGAAASTVSAVYIGLFAV